MRQRRLSAQQRASVERAFLDLLRRRRPDVAWTIDGPGEGSQGLSTSTTGKVRGSVTSGEHEGALLNRQSAAGAQHHRANQ